ncbi:MAG: hypothetical protein HKM97_13895 [Acidimicrobiia bacterium]|nr:hypothetical protein [Acidimicrobiia bacterium]
MLLVLVFLVLILFVLVVVVGALGGRRGRRGHELGDGLFDTGGDRTVGIECRGEHVGGRLRLEGDEHGAIARLGRDVAPAVVRRHSRNLQAVGGGVHGDDTGVFDGEGLFVAVVGDDRGHGGLGVELNVDHLGLQGDGLGGGGQLAEAAFVGLVENPDVGGDSGAAGQEDSDDGGR